MTIEFWFRKKNPSTTKGDKDVKTEGITEFETKTLLRREANKSREIIEINLRLINNSISDFNFSLLLRISRRLKRTVLSVNDTIFRKCYLISISQTHQFLNKLLESSTCLFMFLRISTNKTGDRCHHTNSKNSRHVQQLNTFFFRRNVKFWGLITSDRFAPQENTGWLM